MKNQYKILINGNWVDGEAPATNVINPSTLETVDQCPSASVSQLDSAVEGAEKAFKTWKNVSHEERTEILNRVVGEIVEKRDEIAALIVAEQGKPFGLAIGEVEGGIAWAGFAANQIMPEKIIEQTDEKLIKSVRKPLGVVASITPWNWPFMIAVWHLFPALRAGNCVISKPSPFTPLSTIKLVEIINNHVPAGVISIIPGDGEIGAAISSHPKIKKIVFTGSTATGKHIMRSASDNLKRLTLELGGNDAGVILPGTDIQKYSEDIFNSAFLNMGQTCAALKRLYVHESQYDEMCDAMVDLCNKQVVGDGMAPDTTFGPIQNKPQFDLVSALVEDARENGADVLCGGVVGDGPGYFYPPTIIANVDNSQRVVQEEQFGPVLPIIKYTDIEEAIAMANDSEVGLGGSAWGPDSDETRAVALQLETGLAWVNCHAQIQPNTPMGGCKMSGFGIEFGDEGLMEFTSHQLLFETKK